MKKILFLLLCTVTMYGQTYPTNPTPFGKISINTNAESTTATKISVQEANNQINWLQPINIPIPISPANYSVTAPTLGAHLIGIDAKLGTIGTTTAGISTRVWFTADQTTITAGTFDLTNPLNKGTVSSHQQTVANDDGQKKYFTTDLVGQPFAMITTFPQGTYAGNLSVSTTPTNANQKFTVELYRCNNAGTPIASGVTGAVTGSLGVTVIMIMDSGEVTLANASVTNLPVSTILGVGGFTINAGERIRYHVSAEKVGTAGGVINESVYYGSSYNSYIDVPVIYNSSSIKDISTVTNGTGTVTDALNTLNTGKENLFTSSNVIPKGSVTGLVNSSITDSGTGSTGIVNVNNFIGGTVTRVLPSGVTSIGQTFNLTGTDNTSSLVNRSIITYNEDTFNSPAQVGFDRRIIVNKTTNQTNAFSTSLFTTSQMGTGTISSLTGVTSIIGGSGTGTVNSVSLYDSNSLPISNTYGITNFIGFNLRNSPQNNVVNSTGVYIGELFGSTVSRAFDSNVSAGTGKFNVYAQGTADNYFKGALLVDAVTNGVDKVRINGTVLSTGYKVAGTVGLLKSDGTVDTSTHVTGSASNGQVSFWSGASSQAGDSAFAWDNTGKRLSIGTNAFGTKLDVLSTSAGALIDNMTLINNSLTAGTEVGLFFSPSNATGNTRGARISAVNDGSNGVSLKFWTGQAVAPITRMTIDPIGNIGVNVTPTATATDKLQVNGNITANAGTTATHVVVKSQLDLKADLASPILTGNPQAPTPTAGDNDTSIATTAFVTGAIATADAGNMKLTGNQTIQGFKSFLDTGALSSSVEVVKSKTSGNLVTIYTGATNAGGTLLELNSTTGNSASNVAKLLVINSGSASLGMPLTIQNNSVDSFTVNKTGDIVGNTVTLNSVLNLKAYTVATLPAGTPNAMAVVTDALAPTYNVTVVGGGAIRIPVFYNGTNWTAH